ncbi:MAG: 50S ribosome-binding GTPase [Methanomicrobia archaeon]|nr:50S ribosome-binding GTPase [Methanomicrobia archaeon]
MPANVTMEYLLAEDEYRKAKTITEKIKALEKMYSTIPKHKGTEKMRLSIKQRLSKYKEKLEKSKVKRGRGPTFSVKKEGAAQVALVGLPNSGKSSILNVLTRANSVVASYPLTTRIPTPGMLEYNDIQLEIVDMPSIIKDISMGKGFGFQLIDAIRNADALSIIVDLSKDPVRDMEIILNELYRSGFRINKRKPEIEIKKFSSGGIVIRGKEYVSDVHEIKKMLVEHKISNALVVIKEKTSLEEFLDSLNRNLSYKKAFIIGSKNDLENCDKNLETFRKRYSEFGILSLSAEKKINIEQVKEKIYEILDIVRVFTKSPGSEPDYPPIAMKRGATILDVAKEVHKQFYKNFKYAKVWGRSVKYDGQRAGGDHVVGEGDIVEIHIK